MPPKKQSQKAPKFKCDTIAVVGVGLIGGSIGLAAVRRKLAGRIIGIGRNEAKLKRAIKLGAISEYATSIAKGVAEADLVVVCTPVDHIVEHATEAISAGKPNAIVTDAGSTKGSIVAAMTSSGSSFIGSHPLAGSDQTGVEHSREDLFEGRVVVVTPTRKNSDDQVNRLSSFWSSLGSEVLSMSPRAHDAALASTSHLPHVLASALAKATSEDNLRLTAGGWQDTTRIAAADPELWQQILLDNEKDVLKSIDRFTKVLQMYREAIENRSASKLKRLLQQGKMRRDAVGS